MISENINKIRTNSSITLTKKSMKRIDDSNYYIFCNNCNALLGFDLKYFKDEIIPKFKDKDYEGKDRPEAPKGQEWATPPKK